MLTDKLGTFAWATTIPTATGRSLLGDVIPLSVARDIANKMVSPWVVVQINTAVTSSAGASVEFVAVSDAQAAIAVDGTATEHGRTPSTAKATLVAGYQMAFPLAMEDPAYEAYLGIISNVTTTALTAGKANVFLHDGPPPGWKALDANVSA